MTRPSSSNDDRISPRFFSGSSSQRFAAADHSDADRENSGLEASAPWLSAGRPQPQRISWVRAATARNSSVARDMSSAQDSALSTSEDGIASRRAILPSVSHANPVVGGGFSPSDASRRA